MSNINPIKFGVAGNQYFKPDSGEDLTKGSNNEHVSAEQQNKQVPTKDVLAYMAATNADLIPVKTQKTLDVSKYVTPEQEARIAAFMEGFEANYDEALAIAQEEFPDLSQQAAGDLALAYAAASYSA